MINLTIDELLRVECIQRGLITPEDELCGCGDAHRHHRSKGPSINELLFASRQHRIPEMARLHREFFRSLMDKTAEYEIKMLAALGLPTIEQVRRYVISGHSIPQDRPFVWQERMELQLATIAKEWMQDILGPEYSSQTKGPAEPGDFRAIKWVVVRHIAQAFDIQARFQYAALRQIADEGAVLTLIMADPNKEYFRAMLREAGKRITTEIAYRRIKVLREYLIDMAYNGKYPLDVARKLHEVMGEGAAWYWQRIARSEATLAENLAFDRMAAENGTRYEEWDAGPGCCLVCAWLDGKVWRTGEGPQPVSATHPHCCVKGTKISTSKGLKNIEDVAVGDYVLTHKGRYRPVVQLHHHIDKDVVMVLMASCEMPDKYLICSANHPILIDGKWIEAGLVQFENKLTVVTEKHDLRQSDILSLFSCKVSEIELFNLSVAGDESYIAGGIVVHNCMCARIATYSRGGHSGELQDRWTRPSPYKSDPNGRPWSKEELEQMRREIQPTWGGTFPLEEEG